MVAAVGPSGGEVYSDEAVAVPAYRSMHEGVLSGTPSAVFRG